MCILPHKVPTMQLAMGRFLNRALAKRTCYRALVREWRTFQKFILWFLQVGFAIFGKGLLAMRFSPIPLRKNCYQVVSSPLLHPLGMEDGNI